MHTARPTDGAHTARAREWLAEPARRSLVRVLFYIVSTRLALYGVVDYAVSTHNPRWSPRGFLDFGSGTLAGILRWDTWWYVSVVEEGYRFDPHQASNIAFLPGFPALIALFRPMFGSTATATLSVANAAFVLAVVALWAWVRDRAGLLAAERAAVILLVYPFSFFFNTGYSEAVYFLSVTLALWAADRDRPGFASVFASFATLTRPMGIFLVPAFGAALVAAARGSRLRKANLLPLLAPLGALGAYAIYLWIVHGTPLAVLRAQHIGWGVGRHWSLFRMAYHVEPLRQAADVFHFLLPVPLLWAAFRTYRRLGPAAGVYALLAACLAVLVGDESAGREVLAVVPVFATVALPKLDARVTGTTYAVSFALLIAFTYGFALGDFMG